MPVSATHPIRGGVRRMAPPVPGASGRGKGSKGIAMSGAKRHRRIAKGTIYGITKGDIRRLARRGGVKRISVGIYDEMRAALRSRLETILRNCVAYVEHRNAKTVTVADVIHSLRLIGRPIYGFDPDTNKVKAA